jgi:hypothetical protein
VSRVPDRGEPGEGGPEGRGPYGGGPDGSETEVRELCEGEPDGVEPEARELCESEPDGAEPDGRELYEGEPDGRELGEMTYWRRRFIALTVGLGILSLIAWAFSGTLGASGAGGSTAADGARTSHGHAARAGSMGSTTHAGAQPQGSASATAQPSASVQPSPSARLSASSAAGARTQAGTDASEQLAALAPQRATHPARACKPGDIVLSLVAGQDSYGQGQVPEFTVDVVSTEARTCGFNVGARHLSVVVRAHGKRLWASADCAAGRGALTTDLTRGVPVIVPVSWNRQTSVRACQGDGKHAPAGSYTASASDGGAASSPVRFTLG